MSEEEKNFREWIANLERRRIRAIQMVLDGAKQKEVAKQFGVTTGAVCQWMSAYREKGWEGLGFCVHDGGGHRLEPGEALLPPMTEAERASIPWR